MPRYYFDLRDETGTLNDEVGEEFPDLEAVQEEAAISLSEMARDAIRRPPHDRDSQRQMGVEVRDESGLLLEAGFAFVIRKKI